SIRLRVIKVICSGLREERRLDEGRASQLPLLRAIPRSKRRHARIISRAIPVRFGKSWSRDRFFKQSRDRHKKGVNRSNLGRSVLLCLGGLTRADRPTRINQYTRRGNTNLEKLAAHTVRKLGLCEDHFLATSFTNTTKERLNRNAVPIAYENTADSSMHIENVESEIQNNITALPPNDENVIMEEQMVEKCAQRTYRPATLNFEMSAEEEDIMEWVHLEPPKHQDIKCNRPEKNIKYKDDSIQRNNKKKNDPKAEIKALKIKNFNLQQKIKNLKSRI
ncbi:PREDICTED: uncharacterized protein LOC105571226, partial [Vollenhovia emeryi]|uniref:uncharacterized protein LOC105571226 n=1 Tax=Vollenhovia emeryi TaxID=411798 RepID=UPI0005F580FE